MVYLGVDEGCKAHRLLDVTYNKIVVSRDIKCEEAVPGDWSSNSVEDVSTQFTIENEEQGWSHGVSGMIGVGNTQESGHDSGGETESLGLVTPVVSKSHSHILPDQL
jgi:hypothetical protein